MLVPLRAVKRGLLVPRGVWTRRTCVGSIRSGSCVLACVCFSLSFLCFAGVPPGREGNDAERARGLSR